MNKQDKYFKGYKPQFHFRTEDNKQQVRDWQEDMKMMEGTFEFDWTNNQDLQIEMGEALPYWLKQYKEVIGYESIYKYIQKKRNDHEEEVTKLVEHIIQVEEREKKLRELMKNAIQFIEDVTPTESAEERRIKSLFASLYPKEEEAK